MDNVRIEILAYASKSEGPAFVDCNHPMYPMYESSWTIAHCKPSICRLLNPYSYQEN